MNKKKQTTLKTLAQTRYDEKCEEVIALEKEVEKAKKNNLKLGKLADKWFEDYNSISGRCYELQEQVDALKKEMSDLCHKNSSLTDQLVRKTEKCDGFVRQLNTTLHSLTEATKRESNLYTDNKVLKATNKYICTHWWVKVGLFFGIMEQRYIRSKTIFP